MGGSGDLLAKKEKLSVESKLIEILRNIYSYLLVGDGSTLFLVEFGEVSSVGAEKVAGRTCRRISSATCR